MKQLAIDVLRVNEVEEETLYRQAVARILLDIQAEHKVTLHEIAAKTSIDRKTISNAANMAYALNPKFLSRLGYVFGARFLTPYTELAGGKVFEDKPDSAAKVVPLSLAVAQRLCSINGPLTHRDLLAVERDARALMAALTTLVERAKSFREAA